MKRSSRRTLLLESLESRMVLSGVPEMVALNTAGESSRSDTITVSNTAFSIADEGTHGRELWLLDSEGEAELSTTSSAAVTQSAGTSLSGYVYVDIDGDGHRDLSESGVPGVRITLTGTDSSGASVSRQLLTNSSGHFMFSDLSAGTYQIEERQPTALADGADESAVDGASVTNDVISNIVLSEGQAAEGNNFGEKGLRAEFVSITWFFASARSSDDLLRETIAWAEERSGDTNLAAAIRNGSLDNDGPPNESPVAANDSYEVDEDGVWVATALTGVLANDSDADGDSLSATLVSDVTHGVLSLGADGSFSYTPNANFHGTDTFTYVASDGSADSNVATVTLTVKPVNDPVVTADDAYSVNASTLLEVAAAQGVLSNDVDVDGDTLTAQLVSATSHGSLSLDADGSFTYTPEAGYAGPDSFTYRASDGTTSSGVATVSITINPVNHAPTGAADSYELDEDGAWVATALTGVLANDSDADGDSLSATLVSDVTHGVLSLGADGSFTYTPDTNFNGTDVFTYMASDGSADSNVATVTLTVDPVNDPAVAADDTYSVNASTLLEVPAAQGVLSNDVDVDGDTLTAELVSTATHGILSLGIDGSFTYTPETGYSGPDSFTYRASDGTAFSDVATVSITINQVNHAPTGAADSYELDEDGTWVATAPTGVLANDSDADGDNLSAALVTDVTHGVLSLSADGSFTYTPDTNFNGTDTFTYVANDGLADSNVTTVTLTVNPVNDPVVAADDTYSVNASTLLEVPAAQGVLSNDVDVDGDTLTVTLNTTTTDGTLVLNGDGSFSYTPAEGFTGTDSFTYTVHDGTADYGPATATVTVALEKLAQYRLEVTKLDGTPTSTVAEGDEFLLKVYVQDLRNAGQGVFAAYLDILYNSSLVSLNGAIVFGADFQNGKLFDLTTPGLINEIGAFASAFTGLGSGEFLLVTIPMQADGAGSAAFDADLADEITNATLLFGYGAIVPTDQLQLNDASLEILAAAGEGELAGSYIEAVDQIFAQSGS